VRGLVPNIVGVDFYDQGKVLAAVNVINGLPANAKPALPMH
jgi:hypothetical protein